MALEELPVYYAKRINGALLLLLLLISFQKLNAQSFDALIFGYKGKAYLSSIVGETVALVDSTVVKDDGVCILSLSNSNLHTGFYRVTFDKNKWLDFINDGKNISITTNVNSLWDSLRVIDSECNKLFYSYLRLNKAYKTKTELLQLILARYPNDDEYYKTTRNRLIQLQNEYVEFVNVKAQNNPRSFVARYIRSGQLPVIDIAINPQQQLSYLRTHALDNVDFSNSTLIYSDVFTNKTIEYLTYYRNPQLPKELLEKEFMKATDTLLNKAKVNPVVYQHITEYLIDGFRKYGLDKSLDYIVDNYVIKDNLCLDVKTEGLIKKRIEQAIKFKIGDIVPNISLPDAEGRERNLKNIDTGNTLIIFYASWCPHCKELLPKLNDLVKSKTEYKLTIFAISLDSKKEDWIEFSKENCPDLLNVCDLKGWDGNAPNDYFIYATPTMFLIDKERKIICKPITFDDLGKYL